MAVGGNAGRNVGINLTVRQNGVTQTFQNIQNGINSIQASNSRLNSSLQSATRSFSTMGNNANNSLKSIDKGIKNVSTSIKAVAAVAVSVFTNKLLNMGASTSQVFNRVNHVFKEGTSDINAWASELERIYGFNSNNLLDSVSTYKQLLTAFGIGNEQAVDMSKNLTTLAEDYAMFRGMDIETVSDAFKSGVIGQTESIQKLGIQIEQTMLQQVASQLGLSKTVKQMNDVELATLRYIAIMYQAGDVNGYYAKTMDTPVAKLQVFKNIWKDISKSIGNLLLELFGKISTFAISVSLVIEKIINSVAGLFGIDVTPKNADKSTKGVDKALGGTQDNIDKTQKKADKLKGSLASFDELVTIDKDTSSSTSDTDTTDDANIFGDVDLSKLYGEGTDTWLSDLRKKIDEKFSKPINLGFDVKLPKLELPNFDNIDLTFGFNADKAKTDLVGIINNILQNAANNISFIVELGVRLADDLGVGTILNSLLETTNKFTSAFVTFNDTANKAFMGFYEGISPIVEWVGVKINDGILFMGELFDKINTWLVTNQPLIIEFTTYIGELCTGVWKLIEPFADTVWETSKVLISEALDVVLNFGTWIMENKEAVTLGIFAIGGALVGMKVASVVDEVLSLTTAFGGFQSIGGAICTVLSQTKVGLLAQSVATNVAAVSQKALNFALSANPIGIVIGVIAGLVAGFVLLYNNCEGFRNVVDGLWDKLKGWGEWLSTVFSGFFSSMWDTIKGVLKAFNDFHIELAKKIIGVFKSIGDFVTGTFTGAFNTAKTFITNTLTSLKDSVSGIIEGIKTTFNGVITFVTGVFSTAWEGAWGGIKKIFSKIWDSFSGIAKAPLNLVIAGINAVINGLNKIKIDIPDWVKKLPGMSNLGDSFGFNIPNIPKLATGGIVDTATVAMVGEAGREAVLPLENNTGWMEDMAYILAQYLKKDTTNNGGGDIHIHTDNFISDDSGLRRLSQLLKPYQDDFSNNIIIGN